MEARRMEDSSTWMHILVRVGLNAVTHPVEYAKVLIQIGHEPLPPYKSRTIFGREKLFYPSVFSYISHIKKRDGLIGCYRGLGSKLAANVVSGLAFQKVTESIKFKELDNKDTRRETLTKDELQQIFFQNTIRETVGRAAAIVVSQPFHVIAVRCMAEFVGEEGHYMGLFTSIRVVYREQGLLGFFSGLIPRLLCDLGALWLGNIIIHVMNDYIVEDMDIKSYITLFVKFIANTLTYPLQVVSNCMAVTGSGIIAGRPPNMPHYTSWIDCYKHLKEIRGLKRGSSLLWRAYSGPLVMLGAEPMMPSPAMFAAPN